MKHANTSSSRTIKKCLRWFALTLAAIPFVVCAGMWTLSHVKRVEYRSIDHRMKNGQWHVTRYWIVSSDGGFALSRERAVPTSQDEKARVRDYSGPTFIFVTSDETRYPLPPDMLNEWWRQLGIYFGKPRERHVFPVSLSVYYGHSTGWTIILPWWLATVVVAAPWTLTLRKPVRRALRRHRGFCVACGYDLRGNEGAQTCSECGNPVPPDGASGASG